VFACEAELSAELQQLSESNNDKCPVNGAGKRQLSLVQLMIHRHWH